MIFFQHFILKYFEWFPLNIRIETILSLTIFVIYFFTFVFLFIFYILHLIRLHLSLFLIVLLSMTSTYYLLIKLKFKWYKKMKNIDPLWFFVMTKGWEMLNVSTFSLSKTITEKDLKGNFSNLKIKELEIEIKDWGLIEFNSNKEFKIL